MKQEVNRTLLKDLASLAVRHRPEEFEELARTLESGEFLTRMIEMLRQMAESSRRHPEIRASVKPGPSPTNANQLPSSLEYLRESDRDKYDLIHNFWKLLVSRELLPTPIDARTFAQQLGLPQFPKKTSRTAIYEALLKFLSAKSLEEIQNALREARSESVQHGVQLKDWADVIMRSKTG